MEACLGRMQKIKGGRRGWLARGIRKNPRRRGGRREMDERGEGRKKEEE